MAPIIDKRAQMQPQAHAKEQARSFDVHKNHGNSHNGHHMNTHAKENANTRHPRKGLEILDFHESWLEEMELYKDHMCGHKQHQHQHHQQQLLSSHNHAHTPAGCQIQSFNQNLLNAITVTAPTGTNTNASDKSHSQNVLKAKSPDRSHKVRNAAAVVSASVVAAAANTLASVAADMKHGERSLQMLLKRRRDEPPMHGKTGNASSNSKRLLRPQQTSVQSQQQPMPHQSRTLTITQNSLHSHSNSHTHSNSQSHSHSHSHSHQSPEKCTAPLIIPMPLPNSSPVQSSAKSGSASSSSKSPAKVIVNQFHASNLLNAVHQPDEKSKILVQNGLTKSAASAYETSFYASHYLTHDNRLGANTAKHDIERQRATGGGVGQVADDPCAAIDDVNDYTDSDSEEEYTGSPFFLQDDGHETHQSRNIRMPIELPPSSTSEDSEAEHVERKPTLYYTPKSILSPSIFPNVPPYLNFSSHAERGPSMPPALHKVLKWKLSPVMPRIVKRVVLNSGFRIIKNTTDWMAIWEKHMKSPGFRTIRSHQKYNHMPGSFRIGRKDSMWRSIYSNMKKFGTKEFGFMQRSYVMPDDLESLRQVWPKNASKLTKWIVKPPASARGTGIRIVNKWSQFPKDRPLVVQKYIERPLLINDSKFDMRIYVVVTSINPLRIYMYKDGLARFASVKYSSELKSLDDRCMHLTNYSINKFSENYSKNEDYNACQGHKWTLQSLWSCLESRGVNTKRLWATLRNLVIKAIISGESGLNRMYRQNVNFRYNCFELFGFDVLLDENLVPWLLEINVSPSLHSELPLDLHVKGPLIQAVLNTALYQVPPKLNEKQQADIQHDLNLKGPLCHDKRIFTTCLTTEEVRKHNQFTNRSIEFREEYVDSILEHLLPDDVRCLIIAEDEYVRSQPLERVFPTPDTHPYLKYIENPRYYNRLLDAWECRYGNNREDGIAVLKRYCAEGYHLQVSDAALEKEPNVTVTEIDLLHAKKEEDPLSVATLMANTSIDSTAASKASTPESNVNGVMLAVPYGKDGSEQSAKSTKDHVGTGNSVKPIVMKVNVSVHPPCKL